MKFLIHAVNAAMSAAWDIAAAFTYPTADALWDEATNRAAGTRAAA